MTNFDILLGYILFLIRIETYIFEKINCPKLIKGSKHLFSLKEEKKGKIRIQNKGRVTDSRVA